MSDEVSRLLYKPEEVASMFGLSKSTIMALRLSEKWPYTKIGGSIMFSREDINEIMARGKKTPEAPRTTRSRRTRNG